MDNNVVIEAEDLTKTYQMGEIEVHALRGLSLKIKRGEIVAVMGPSGSGKSTLMNILGCLDRATTGKYVLDGEDVKDLSRNELADIRNRRVGFVFQSYNLLSRSSALSNVMLSLRYHRNDLHDPRKKAEELLVRVGLGDRMSHKPFELSGGQQQRVAIARALACNPQIIICDEPTSNLDHDTGRATLEILRGHAKSADRAVIVVTHDPRILPFADRIAHIDDGRIIEISNGAQHNDA